MSLDGIKNKISIYFKYQELKIFDRFTKIEDFDHKDNIQFVHMNAKRPEIKFSLYLKPKLENKSNERCQIFFNWSGENNLIIQKE